MKCIMKNGRDLKPNNKHINKIIFWVIVFICVFIIKENNYARYISLHDYEDTISFVGDIYPKDTKVIKAYLREGGISNVVHSSYKKILDNSDYVVGNLECCISDKGDAADKQFTFKIDPKYKNIINEAGINLVTVANNHSVDFGKEALKDTLRYLKETNVSYVGVGDNEAEARKPFEKIIQGRKYVIFAASQVAPTHKWFAYKNEFGINNGYNSEAICKKIKQKRKEEPESVIIVYMHWGKEKEEYPSELQIKTAHDFIDVGCDLVIGSHPHVFQNIEYYKNVPIIYSLGNFIYGDTSTETMVLDVIFDYSVKNKKKIYLKIHPGLSGYERVILLGYQNEREKKVMEILSKCPTCMLNEEGFIVEKIQ